MEKQNKIRTREEIPEEDKWAIEDLYPSDEAWETELATVAEDEKELASYNGKLGHADAAAPHTRMLVIVLDRVSCDRVEVTYLGQ